MEAELADNWVQKMVAEKAVLKVELMVVLSVV